MALMLEKKEGNRFIREFDNWDDFMEKAEKGESEMSNFSRSSMKSDSEHSKEWSGTDTFKEAMELARNGWPEGLETIYSLTEKIKNFNGVLGSQVKKLSTYYDFGGDYADVDRYLTGIPEAMGNFDEEIVQGAGKIITIVLNLSASCGVSTQTMELRGATTAALIDVLEYCGRSCEVIITAGISASFGGSGGRELEYRCTVKRAGEALDIDRMAYALAHPACFRRLVFSLMEQENKDIRQGFNIGGSYGCPLTSEEQGDIYIDCQSLYKEKIFKPENAVGWVLKQLKNQGIEVEGD